MIVVKRNGKEVDFDPERIVIAIHNAIVDVEHLIDITAEEAEFPYEIANLIEQEVEEKNKMSVEEIQDRVEIELMYRAPVVAKAYILYRFQQQRERMAQQDEKEGLLSNDFISKYKHLPSPMTQLGNFVFYRTYSRFLSEAGRRERWWETVKRAVEYNTSLAPTSRKEAEKLFDNIFHLRQFPAGRTLFTGGTEVSKKYGMSNFNCSFTIANDFACFKDLFYLLLIGAGVGLRIRKKDVAQLPKVRGDLKLIHKAFKAVKIEERIEYTSLKFKDDTVELIIGDSKEAFTQGLDYLLKFFYLREFSKLKTIIVNYNNIRPAGERLKTFGGYASGHQPYMLMIDKIYDILTKNNSSYKKLSTLDCLDMANIIGVSVVSGGVRRTSEVMLFDSDDEEVKNCKSNLFMQIDGEWQINEEIQHRRMSNNSIQYERRPTKEEWHEHIQAMRFSGEPGFHNLAAAKERRADAEGANPCVEIILRKNGVCNLTEVNALAFVKDGEIDKEGILEAQKLSARMGYRMACIEFELHEWDKVNKEDRLIGCSLTGWQDMVNATGMSMEEQAILLQELRKMAHEAANALADELGENRPKLYTTIKPSGTISQLPTVSPGLHFSHSPYYIRRVRINANDPLVQVVRELDYPIFPEVGQTEDKMDTAVIEFPAKAPEGNTKYDVTAIEQLEIYKMFMDNYVDHNASITVHVRPHEWDAVEEWVYNNWDSVVGISFISLDDSFYKLMPYEKITQEEYEEREKQMRKFNPSLLQKYEKEEMELDIGEPDCDGMICPIR